MSPFQLQTLLQLVSQTVLWLSGREELRLGLNEFYKAMSMRLWTSAKLIRLIYLSEGSKQNRMISALFCYRH